jgi:hypothetical protein
VQWLRSREVFSRKEGRSMTIIHKERALESQLSASQPAGRAREIFIGWLGRTKRKPHVEAQTDAHHA